MSMLASCHTINSELQLTSRGTPIKTETLADHILFLPPVASAHNSHGKGDNLELVFQVLEGELAFVIDESMNSYLPIAQFRLVYDRYSTMVSDKVQVRRSQEALREDMGY